MPAIDRSVTVAVAAVTVFAPPPTVPTPSAAPPVAALGLGVLDPEHGRVAVNLVQAVVGHAHLGDRSLSHAHGGGGGGGGGIVNKTKQRTDRREKRRSGGEVRFGLVRFGSAR